MSPHRTHSLDTLRAAAILLVFFYHYKGYVSGTSTFGWASDFGWVGVDLFFVLSGYLIGNQLFAGLRTHRNFSLRSFYARRALRTWPAYWFVLALYFLMPSHMGGHAPPALWRFLSFTQNFHLQPGTAFSHAWSLCIEEQFYLVLPLVVLVACRIGSTTRQAWLLMLSFSAVGICTRAILWLSYGREGIGGTEGYYANIYYATLCRFDEFIPGIAVAFIKHYHTPLWNRLMAHGLVLFSMAGAAVVLALYGAHSHFYDGSYGFYPFMTIAGYTLISWAFGLLVVAALSPGSPLQRIKIPGAFYLASWSYTIYLSHKAVAFILNKHLRALDAGPEQTVVAISCACLVIGALLHYFIEQPFMRLRDAKVPSLFRAPKDAA